MTPIEALHTAARRYPENEALLWHGRYAQSGTDPNRTDPSSGRSTLTR